MGRCCRGLCTKARGVFVWGLLECLFFAGLLHGWAFILGIFQRDQYFVSKPCAQIVNISYMRLLASPSEPPKRQGNEASVSALANIFRSRKLNNESQNLDLANHGEPREVDSADQAGVGSEVDGLRRSETLEFRSLGDHNATMNGMKELCLQEQNVALSWVYLCGILLTGVLSFPLGVLYDRYGTLRVRVIAIVLFTASTLMITFSSTGSPWLLFPAMTAVGLCGVLLLVTNLQTSNLLTYRITAIMIYHAACDTGGFVQYFIKSSAEAGLNIQSSYMFMTIGLVPMLIGTIAFLPKRRVPWPVPNNYHEMEDSIGAYVLKNSPRSSNTQHHDHFVLDFSANVGPDFPLFLAHVVWAASMLLRIRAFELDAAGWCNEKNFAFLDHSASHRVCIYGAFQPCACAICLLLGFLMDRQIKTDDDEMKCRKIMRDYTLVFLAVTCMELVLSSMMTMASAQAIVYVILSLHVTLRILVPASSASFLYTVLPHVHFGKHYGFMLACAAVLQAVILYPIQLNVLRPNSSRGLNITYVFLSAICLLYPLLLWMKYRHHQFQIRPLNDDLLFEPKASTYITEERHTDTLIASDDCPNIEENAF